MTIPCARDLGRLIDAIDGTDDLPAKEVDGLLCGMEFATLAQEQRFFEDHDVPRTAFEQRVIVEPGQAMVFDNLACAHGRSGRRQARELHQLCVGFHPVPPDGQRWILRQFLNELTGEE
jgi:hypothetical protein